jgi:hypothetical protein
MGREEVNKLYSDHNHTYAPGAEIVASSIVAGLKAFKDSPLHPPAFGKGEKPFQRPTPSTSLITFPPPK